MINPAMIKLAAGCVALASIFGFGVYVGKGLEKSASAAAIKVVEDERDSCRNTAIETERQNIEALKLKQDQIDEANTLFAEQMNNAKIELDRLTADYRNDKRVLTSKVKACVQTSRTDNSGATVTETRAELDSGTSESLVRITARCDQITIQLNALIDAVGKN